MQVRDTVNAALEEKRKDKVIGNSLGASVTLTATRSDRGAARTESRVSADALHRVGPDAEPRRGHGADDVRVDVGKARGVKCGRCWRFVPSVRTEPDWAGICDRCVEALAEPVNS